jgi:outer membrane receptor for ferrienterochelin and colicins
MTFCINPRWWRFAAFLCGSAVVSSAHAQPPVGGEPRRETPEVRAEEPQDPADAQQPPINDAGTAAAAEATAPVVHRAEPAASLPVSPVDAPGPRPAAELAPESAAKEPENLLRPHEIVVVTGRRSEEILGDAPIAIEVIDRQQIASIGARDVGQILSTQPGIQIERSFRGDAIQMQGLDPQHTLVLVDGERIVGARDGALDLTRFFASDVERIEIVRGPASAIYGSDAMAGVINIITRPSVSGLSAAGLGRYGATRGAADVFSDIGQHGDAWVNVSGGVDKLRGRLSASYRREAPFDLIPQTPATTGNQLDLRNLQGRIDWIANERTRLPFSLRMQRREQLGIDESGTGAVYDRRIRTDETAYQFAPRFTLRQRDVLTTSLAYTQIRSQYSRDQRRDDDGDSFEDYRERLASARLQYDALLAKRLLMTSGIEALGQDLVCLLPENAGAEEQDACRFDAKERIQRGRISAYTQADITLTEGPKTYVVLSPSARVDVDSQYGVNISPRLTARVDPMDGLILRAGAGRGFRAPSLTELYLAFANPGANYRVSGNQDLGPETSLGSNISAELSRIRWFIATLNLFRNDLHDLIDTRLTNDPSQNGGEQLFSYVNVKRARTQGVEAMWRIKATDWLVLDLTYTLTHARDLDERRPLSGRALQRGSARFALGGETYPWSASLRALTAGRRYFYTEDVEGNTTKLTASAYLTADARCAYRIGSHFEPFLSAENLTDTGGTNLPLRPVTLYVGLSIF